MKIKELNIKNFGKFSDKKIVLNDGINLFYGENESGKTTIHTFIKSILFGLERGRGRASVNDTFSLYEPWENPNYYAGMLRFECGGKRFCLERSFDKYSKNASLVCEDDGEEFSLEHGDLEMLLGGLNASNYENTVAIAQMQVEPNQNLAVELQNYATNYYATGSGDIDLEGALNALNKKKKETEKEIREEMQKKQQRRSDVEQEASYVWRDICRYEQELESVESRLEQLKLQHAKRGFRPAWLVGVLPPMCSLLLLDGPWNYLAAIILVLGEMLLLWRWIKSNRKGVQKQTEKTGENLEKILWQKEHLQTELKEKQIQYSNLQEQLDELDEVDEGVQQKEFQRRALELAADRMQVLSKDVHKQLSRELNKRASEVLAEITGGKYTMLLIDEKLKMHLFTGDRRIDILQVSRGTIEQIYFALRMAASEILYEEEFPIILDDTFVFYDDERLGNTLRWLVENKKQILLFTCQKREGEWLKNHHFISE